MPLPCAGTVVGAAEGVNSKEADALLLRVKNLAEIRAANTGKPIDDALRDIKGEIIAEEKTMSKVYERNTLLTIQKKQDLKKYVDRFVAAGRTVGEGVLAFLQGSARLINGARLSIDYQAKALHGKYFGRMVAEMDKAGVLSAFKSPDADLLQAIYREMGNQEPGQPAKSITGNDIAFQIAQIIDNTMAELVARQNRAGAFIRRMPGYVMRQTHDQAAIRALGGIGNNPQSKNASYKAWSEFVKPLVDFERTFQGADPDMILRNIHEALYSGIHGPARDEADVMGNTVIGSLANKVSQARVLHFKDADSALKYNQAFGIKNFKEQILHDLHVRTRSVALMENLGPSPDATLKQVIRELQDEARTADDAAKQVDSLNDWRIQAAFNEISGRNEMSANPTLSNVIGTGKVIAQMAKMGSVVLSSFSDRAFLQAEMAHQGMSHLQVLGAQLTSLLPKSAEQKQMLRLMGVAMDGLMGNALSRYSNHSTTSGWAHELQKHFFNLNGLNMWTDASKGAAAQLMAAHLGEHSHLPMGELPGELRNVLSLYDITPSRWDAIRVHSVDYNNAKLILPDQIKIPSGIEPLAYQGRKIGGTPNENLSWFSPEKETAAQFGKVFSGPQPELKALSQTQFNKLVKEIKVTPEEYLAFNHQAIKEGKKYTFGGEGNTDWLYLPRVQEEIKKRGYNAVEFNEPEGTSIGYLGKLDLKEHQESITLKQLVEERGLTASPANIARERDAIETAVRTYIADRVDHAIPTPGSAERKYTTFDTKAGTPLGEAVRAIMLFKSFPITIMRKILGREIYGRGANSLKDWLLHDHMGKFNLAMMIGMGTAIGYVSGAIKDALKGRTPKQLIDDDGSIIWKNVNDAAIRGGSLGILGDVLLSEYESNYRGFLASMAGPIVGQADALMDIKTGIQRGESVMRSSGKFLTDNAPLINLFYIRPILDYVVLWQMQEMMSPGSLRRMESSVERNNKQGFFVKPSETVGH